MLSSGFASSTRKSALLFVSIVPAAVIRRNCAPLRVAAVITCIGVIPAATIEMRVRVDDRRHDGLAGEVHARGPSGDAGVSGAAHLREPVAAHDERLAL